MTREEEKNKARFEYVSKRLANPDYPTYNDEYELECAYDAGCVKGYEQAIDDAVKWLEKHLPQCIEIEENYVVVNYGLIADFEKAMKGD